MEPKKCRDCGETKPANQFSSNSKRPDQAWCKDCKRAYDAAYYRRTRDRRAARTRTTKKALRERNRRFILDYLAQSRCADCGIADMVVLEFDHLDEKNYSISDMINGGFSLENLQKEVALCEVVCANCHRRRTYSRMAHLGWGRVSGV